MLYTSKYVGQLLLQASRLLGSNNADEIQFLFSDSVNADHNDYGKLPLTDPNRMSSPNDQQRNLQVLLKTAPFTREWVNKNILSGFFKMENSPTFAKKFPQVQALPPALNLQKLDLFRNSLTSLTDADVSNDYSSIGLFVQKSRKLLTVLNETLHKMPNTVEAIQLWVEKLQQLSEAFSSVLDEGIVEVKHLKSITNK